MRHGTHRTSLFIALTLSTGLTCPLVAQTTPDRPIRDTPSRDRAPAQDGTRTPTVPPATRAPATATFHLASELIGMDVVNPKEESLGEVVDVVVDRGSGRIEHALIKSGAFLGMGGRTVAIPFGAFSLDLAEERLVLTVSPDEIKQIAKVAPEQWKELEGTAWDAELARPSSRAAEQDARADAYAIAIAAATEEAMNGRIVAVRRLPVAGTAEEEVVAVVETSDGATREVVLGPSWFVMSQPTAPMRGDELEARVRTVTVDGATPRTYVSSSTIRGTKVDYRDEKARPMWRTERDAEAKRSSDRDGKRLGRLMLLSALLDADARPLDEDGGDIEDAVIELSSGRIALLCFDPDENFLGLGDTVRCIPWSIAIVDREGDVRFDASRDMLLKAPTMPENVRDFSDAALLRETHATFGVDAPRFDPVMRTTSR